jgi:hypothetical protein
MCGIYRFCGFELRAIIAPSKLAWRFWRSRCLAKEEPRSHLIDVQQRVEMPFLATLREEVRDIKAVQRAAFETLPDRTEPGRQAVRIVELVEEADAGIGADLARGAAVGGRGGGGVASR